MEILRFGPGFRSLQAPAGTRGVAEQAIWGDPRARVSDLALSRRAVIGPRSSADLGLFIVVSGGGWVQVGEERAAIHHGEAVEWPPGVTHGVWTDGSEMRAILVELPDSALPGSHVRLAASDAGKADAAVGALAKPTFRPEDRDESQGEPW